MVCTQCGLGAEYCTCDQTLEFADLTYAEADFEVPDKLVRQLNSVKRDHGDALRAWADICDADATGSNVRKAHFWTVPSVQERTAVLDRVTDRASLNDFQSLKRSVEATYDGDVKWEKVHAVWTADLPEMAAADAREDNWAEFMATLTGLEKGYNGRSSENYVRAVKSALVAEILGDPHALCLDSARRAVLEPLFDRMFDGPRRGTHQGLASEWRGQAVDATVDKVHPGSKEFIEDRLTYNPREYRAITKAILDALTDATRLSRREVSHALFILGNQDGVTAHEPLAEMLD